MREEFKPGMRIVKTSVAVAICLLIAYAFSYYQPFYASIAAVLVMKSTPEQSFRYGLDRLIGTLWGGFLGFVLLNLGFYFNIPAQSFTYIFIVVLLVFFDLWIAKIFSMREYAVSMSLILLLSVLLIHNDSLKEMNTYMIYRVLETLFGIIVALLVNRFFPDFKDKP